MKQKIKIMKSKPELSDEEIRSYMDFEKLVKNAELAPSSIKTYSIVKYSIPILVIATIAVWFSYHANTRETLAEAPKIVTDEKINSISPIPQGDVPSPAAQSTQLKTENKIKKLSAPESTSTNTKDAVKPKQATPATTDNVYIQAEPVNGYTALYEYFNNNLVYPDESVGEAIEGVLAVTFTINPEGKPESILVKQSLGIPFEREAHRLIENMPAWKPATLNGKAVSSQMSIPLTFQIKKVTVNDQP